MRHLWASHPISCSCLVQVHQHPCSLRRLASRQSRMGQSACFQVLLYPSQGPQECWQRRTAPYSVRALPAPYNAIYSAGAPPAPCNAVQRARAPRSAAFQPMTGMQWPLPTPYASPFMAPPAWPMYMPSYLPRPLSQPPFLQAQFEELARQNQDMEANELEIQRISRSLNLKAVNARTLLATSARGHRSEPRPLRGPPHRSKLFLRLWHPLLPVRMGLARPRRFSLGLFHRNPLIRLSLTLEKWNPLS